MQQPQAECQTMSVRDAGKILGVSKNTAYNAARTGQIAVIRIGGKMLVSRAVLDKILSGEDCAGKAA
jgi:excisionase family DNA binding protein